MKKISLLLLPLAMLIYDNACAQMIDGSTSAVVQRPKPVVAQPAPSQPAAVAAKKISEEDVKAVIDGLETPPVAMTPEQKAEIDLAAKKNLKMSLKKQSVRDRKDFIDVMTSAEKVQKRRAALLQGKSENEAAQAEAEVEKPAINPAQDSEMEQYLYQKAGLVNEQ